MEITIRLSRPALIVFLILALTLGLTSSQALAQPPVPPNPAPDSPELMGGSPVPGGPGYVSIGPYDFLPKTPGTIPYVMFGMSMCALSSGSGELAVYAPIQLPQGAQINKVVVYYLDDNPNYLTVRLAMHPLLSNEDAYYLANFAVGTNQDAYTYTFAATTAINSLYATVNNAANSYLVYVNLPATGGLGAMCLTGVRVDYGYPSSLPLVVR